MKKEEAKQKTTAALLKIARVHFTQYGYHDASLEKIAEEAGVTRGAVYHHFKSKKGLFLAVLDAVQKDVARHIEREAEKSDDPWQQLVLGCVGFVKGSNAKGCRRILLADAPAVVGWDAWRKADRENSLDVLLAHVRELEGLNLLAPEANAELMAHSISGALNELALHYSGKHTAATDAALHNTIRQMVSGFRK